MLGEGKHMTWLHKIKVRMKIVIFHSLFNYFVSFTGPSGEGNKSNIFSVE